jgi:exodeoxyribonuclease V alpha subunit
MDTTLFHQTHGLQGQVGPSPILNWLAAQREAGQLDALDVHFARLLHDMGASDAAVVAGAIASADLAQGHCGVPLGRLTQVVTGSLLLPRDEPAWQAALQACDRVGARQPLVLDKGFVYLNRYWQYECFVARRMAVGALEDAPSAELVARGLAELFAPDWRALAAIKAVYPADQICEFAKKWLDVREEAFGDGSPEHGPLAAWLAQLATADTPQALADVTGRLPASSRLNWQQVAVAQACRQRLLIISGGPGTGKTTTVTRLLALLQQLQLESGQRALSIGLVAPTGKAAARLTASIGQAKGGLKVAPEVRGAIPEQAGTIHRLLGVIPGSNRFRHDGDNPLPLDLLVVDEASMIDLPLMARLLAALPSSARLILLGDRDQLASVEAGAVLGDLCSFMKSGISPALGQYLSGATGSDFSGDVRLEAPSIADNLVMLRKSYRFDAASGIGQLAAAVNAGQAARAMAQFDVGFADIDWQPLNSDSYNQAIEQASVAYSDYLEALRSGKPMARVFELFHSFQLLVALREGTFGVEGLNQALQRSLHRRGLLEERTGWCAGLPLMIESNDHEQQIYNGDIGILAKDESGRLMVVLETANGLRWMLPSRLPDHSPVFAMTVHKSQGSEFARVLMVLPPKKAGGITRELLYTGITRAKAHFSLLADAPSLERACSVSSARHSGLSLRFE